MEIKKSVLTDAFDLAFPALLDEQIRTDYSGRFMFGKTCFGIVGNTGTLGVFMAHVAVLIPELRDYDFITNLRWDEMGLDMIYYWPDIQIIDDMGTNA